MSNIFDLLPGIISNTSDAGRDITNMDCGSYWRCLVRRLTLDTSASSGGAPSANRMTTPPSARSATSGPTAVTRVFNRTDMMANLFFFF
jgi:hypothetical protein